MPSESDPRVRARDDDLSRILASWRSEQPSDTSGWSELASAEELRARCPLVDGRVGVDRGAEVSQGSGVISGDAGAREHSGSGASTTQDDLERDLRARAVEAWRARAGAVGLDRVLCLRRDRGEGRESAIIRGDLRAYGNAECSWRSVSSLASIDDLAEIMGAFRPTGIVWSSAGLCRRLEQATQSAVERQWPSVRAMWFEHDFEVPIRSRLPRLNVGWPSLAGRIAIPSDRGPGSALELAAPGMVVELLEWSDPDRDGRSRPTTRTVWPEEAVIGARYELVVTAACGWLRRRLGVHVRVVGFAPPLPGDPRWRPRFVRRLSPPSDVPLEGVTLAGAHVTAAVRQAFRPEDPALVGGKIFVGVRRDAGDDTGDRLEARSPGVAPDEGISRRGRRAGALEIEVEVQGFASPRFIRMLSDRIDRDLRHRSAEYQALREARGLRRPQVRICTSTAAADEQLSREMALDGPVRANLIESVRRYVPQSTS